MRSSALDYDLPPELIAQAPRPSRESARLLALRRGGGALEHRIFHELPSLLPPCLFVFNDTRVIPARLRGVRDSGGKVELLLVERLGEAGTTERWRCMARPLKSLRPGQVLRFDTLVATVVGRCEPSMLEVDLSCPDGVAAGLEVSGELPLPPYIARPVAASDRERYQTVFAREPGAVAAPTAGLHFGQAVLDALLARGHQRVFVTLHVGPGTFLPLQADDLADHRMHAERYRVPAETAEAVRRAKLEARPVIAVGTTVVRTLESAADATGTLRVGEGSSDLCIYPPYTFRVIDGLVTNFHLPRSTLLALVMAFAGEEPTRRAYAEAVSAGYRFFSYGDAMLVKP